MNFTNFPLVYLITLISTNWVPIPRETKFSQGTNYVLSRQVITTNTVALEVTLCTNRIDVSKKDSGTNGALIYRPTPDIPGTPGRL